MVGCRCMAGSDAVAMSWNWRKARCVWKRLSTISTSSKRFSSCIFPAREVSTSSRYLASAGMSEGSVLRSHCSFSMNLE